MDPINIITGLNILFSLASNLKGAQKGLKSTFIQTKERPKTYLQKLPLVLATLTLIGLILGIFRIGTIEYKQEYQSIRVTGLLVYLIFSWIQIWAYKSLGEYYSQDILLFKDHKLVIKGPFKFIRHPQYLSQILLDLGGGLATLSYIVLPLAIIQAPFIIMRAAFEEKLLGKYFKDEFPAYKKKTGFMIPFIG
jgi:protein-S-isoprenylcysteine O-methyltransferase Ste14